MKIIEMMKRGGKTLIGMVHVLPLPGTMNYGGSMDKLIHKAVFDARTLESSGFEAVLVEPTLDKPSGMRRGPLQLAAMSAVCSAVHQAVPIPMGVSFFTPDCQDVFAIAKASGADFVRLTTFVDTVVFPADIAYPSAVRAWEIRRQDGMQGIAILADIQVKHGKMLYPDTRLEESAFYAQHQGADAIVVTGSATGQETPMESIRRVRKVSKIPVVVGSGVSAENIRQQMTLADGFIVGSSIKLKGDLAAPVDADLAAALCKARRMEV